jgi:hypothetical protein
MNWTPTQLDAVRAMDDLTLLVPWGETGRRAVPVWVVAVGSEVWVRSYKGVHAAWYRHAVRAGQGAVRVAGTEVGVRFEPVTDGAPTSEIDAAYRVKYGRHSYVDSILQPAAEATVRLRPDERNEA